jgi:zinc/manganese transport system permease protein
MSELAFLAWPFVAGLLVLATHVPLGRLVLARGIVFVDLAVAQVAGLGALIAHWLGWDGTIGVQAMALTAALSSALLLTWTERHFAPVQEAIIGTLFVGTASLELVLLAYDAHGAAHLRDLLVGQVLWVEPRHLWPAAILALAVPAAMRWTTALETRWVFYAVFAICITASVQIVGIYLVFASLIAPALGRWRPFAMGALGYAAGLAISALTDLPAGPCIVLALICTAIAGATIDMKLPPRS